MFSGDAGGGVLGGLGVLVGDGSSAVSPAVWTTAVSWVGGSGGGWLGAWIGGWLPE